MNTRTNLTIDNFKALTADRRYCKLAARVLAAQTIHETIAEKVASYRKIVFDRVGPFKVGPTICGRRGDAGEIITDEKRLFLCEDKEQMKLYYSCMDAAHRTAGYDLTPGYCPALIAESHHGQCVQAFLEYADSKLGTPFSQTYLEQRDKAVDLLLPLALKNPLTETISRRLLPRTQKACARLIRRLQSKPSKKD